jgi:hypothetical protein
MKIIFALLAAALMFLAFAIAATAPTWRIALAIVAGIVAAIAVIIDLTGVSA